jgi:hypothetical protein
VRYRTRKGLAALAVVLGSALPAQAFYWRGWPASIKVPDKTLVPDDNPTGSPTPITPPPVYVPPDIVPVGPPVQTPEPATGVIALLGLGTVAVLRKRKR